MPCSINNVLQALSKTHSVINEDNSELCEELQTLQTHMTIYLFPSTEYVIISLIAVVCWTRTGAPKLKLFRGMACYESTCL